MALNLKLSDGLKNNIYSVRKMTLPNKTAKRLEALGMISGTAVSVLNIKKSALIIEFRGTRFALGKAIAKNIEIELAGDAALCAPQKEGGTK
jgi:ferrous iron transport protein A